MSLPKMEVLKMTDKQIMTAFINIARELYESAYGEEVGKEATVSADLVTGKRIVITITEEEQETEVRRNER